MGMPERAAALRLLLVAASAVAAAGAAKVPAMFVFGDSTADVGNNDYLPAGSSVRANFPHNGVDFPGGGEPTGRFSNGLIGVDFLAAAMGFSRSPPPYLSLVANISSSGITGEVMTSNRTTTMASMTMRGANFASGGSGVLDSTGSTINMTKQIEYFSDLRQQMSARWSSGGAAAVLSKSIFLISAGANDAMDFFSQLDTPDANAAAAAATAAALQQFREAVVSTYDSHVKTLYNLGARRFGVIDVPMIGCCPYWRSRNPTGECVEGLNQLARSLNDGIRGLFGDLSSEMPAMKYAIASSYELLSSLIENPHSAGFMEEKKACCGGGGSFNADEGCTPRSGCCGDRSRFVFWDLMHPTQAAGEVASLAFYDGAARFVGPITFKQLAEE